MKLVQPRTQPYYTFDPEGIQVSGNVPRYFVGAQPNQSAPVVYFKARRDGASGRMEYGFTVPPFTALAFQPGADVTNVARPYLDRNSGANPATDPQRSWRNPDSFQIIHPGPDGRYSGHLDPANTNPVPEFRWSQLGTGFTDGDYDNVTNFAVNLEDELE